MPTLSFRPNNWPAVGHRLSRSERVLAQFTNTSMKKLLLCGTLALAACTGSIEGPRPDGTGGPLDPQAGPPVYAPAGIRRLSQAEVLTAATALVGLPADELATAVGADIRQAGFTRNSNQRVGSDQAQALWQAAQHYAHDAVTQRLSTLAPCSTPSGSEACAGDFITRFAGRAFRRAVTAEEKAALLTVYRAGLVGANYASGIELVITAVLQSASFLYVTELGAPAASGVTTLSGEELATQLAFLFTGAPADDALMAAGRAGQLADPEVRASTARAMLATPAGKQQVERMILEWQGSDEVAAAPKDVMLFPAWTSVRADMLQESRSIIDAVLFQGDGTLQSLLSTPQTTVTPALASFYELTGTGPITQPAFRKGLLLAGAFSASHAHPSTTAPVKRGNIVRRKLLCQELTIPTIVAGVTIMVPAPDPTKTTRERFEVHSLNPNCAGCHRLLDPIGFALENFDAVGRYRTMENGKPIDPSGELVGAGDADGAFTDAVGMVELLAKSKSVEQCFERQLYRFVTGRSGTEEERTLGDFFRGRPSSANGQVLELLVDYARSDVFAKRSAP